MLFVCQDFISPDWETGRGFAFARVAVRGDRGFEGWVGGGKNFDFCRKKQ